MHVELAIEDKCRCTDGGGITAKRTSHVFSVERYRQRIRGKIELAGVLKRGSNLFIDR